MLLSVLLSACAPAMLQTARTNGEGNFQFAVEPGAWAGVVAGQPVVLPAFNLSGRYGVSDRVDLGLRLGTTLYEIQTKFLLTDPAATDRVALALAPSTTLIGGGLGAGGSGVGGIYWNTRVPLLVGVPVGQSELTIGPRITPLLVGLGGGVAGTEGSARAFVLLAGTSVSYAGHVANRFRIVPELGVDVPLVGAASASAEGTGTGSARFGYGGVLLNAGLGFLFGGPVEEEEPPAE